MTMHIDEALLDRVILAYGFTTKTEAVEGALREMDRRARWKVLAKTGLGLKPAELMAAVDPDYDVLAMRVADKSVRYGKKRSD